MDTNSPRADLHLLAARVLRSAPQIHRHGRQRRLFTRGERPARTQRLPTRQLMFVQPPM